jgi:hypothetical protein
MKIATSRNTYDLKPGDKVVLRKPDEEYTNCPFSSEEVLLVRNVMATRVLVTNEVKTDTVLIHWVVPAEPLPVITPGTEYKVAANHSGHCFNLGSKVKTKYLALNGKAWLCIDYKGATAYVMARDLKPKN